MSKGFCFLCKDVLESKHRHDFVRCKCGKSFLDGGDDYWRSSMTTVPFDAGKDMTEEEFLNYLEKFDGKEKEMVEEVFKDEPEKPNQFLEGIYACHDIISDTISRMRQSLDDMWAITTSGLLTADVKAQEEKIRFALGTLTTLEDMFADAYDTRLDEMKANGQRDTEGH